MKTKKSISVCGIDCKAYSTCDKCSSICKNMHSVFDLKKPCEGCNEIHEKILLSKHISLNICPIYECVINRHYQHCGNCEQLPCDLYYELKDPFINDFIHGLDIEHRVNTLKSMKE
jgi:hypothetical protein